MKRSLLSLAALFAASAPALAQGDPEVIAKIIEEGKNNSQVWQTLTYLSEEIGTRLMGSSNLERANTWTRDYFTLQGLTNAHLAKWGEIPVRFDRGPSSAKMVAPEEREFEFTTSSWGAGTNGPVRGKVVKEPTTMEELAAVQGELEGAWVLTKQRRARRRGADETSAEDEFRAALDKALAEAKIAGKLIGTSRDEVVTSGRGYRELTMATLPTDVEVQIRRTDYDILNSRLSDGEEVEVEVDLKHYFTEGPIPLYNTVAEIRGSEFPDEVIIVSAHLDTWDGPGSTGTQDNGTGSSVTLETARILMASGAVPRRTIRFCLWTGEEQGLLGSRAYVEQLSEEERAKISAVFVDDGGTNYQGGLVCVPAMAPMLEEATKGINEAFPDLQMTHQVQDTMPRGGGSDHASFNAVGIPGFFWIEKGSGGREGRNYRFVHHTQHDTMRYAVEEYLVQSATSSAVTAYNLAMADGMLPRYVAPEGADEESGRERGERPGRGERPAAPPIDANFKAVETAISGTWNALYTEADMAFELELQSDANGAVMGSMRMNNEPRKLENGTWNADKKTLTFEYDSGTYGRLTSTAVLQEDGSLKGSVKSGPDSEGYPWKATKKKAEGQ